MPATTIIITIQAAAQTNIRMVNRLEKTLVTRGQAAVRRTTPATPVGAAEEEEAAAAEISEKTDEETGPNGLHLVRVKLATEGTRQ